MDKKHKKEDGPSMWDEVNHFFSTMEQRRAEILKENIELMNRGSTFIYQHNCNFITGMNFVVDEMKKLRVLSKFFKK